MLNTRAFGEFVRATRGTRTQADLADKANTFRQRFGQIENGQPHDLSETALTQLETALEWPTGYAQAALRATQEVDPEDHPVTYQSFESSDWDPCHLGFFADGSALVSVRRIASSASSVAFLPMIFAARRTTLIDVHALDDEERQTVGSMAKQWKRMMDGRGRAVRTVATLPGSGDAHWTPVTIDPLPGIISLGQALTLTRRLRTIDDNGFAGADDMSIALSLLAAAIDLGEAQRTGEQTDGIDLIARGPSPSVSFPLLEEVGGLPVDRYGHYNLSRVFRGLLDARDALIDIVYHPGASPPVSVVGRPEVIAAQNLTDTLVLFDSRLTPELPVVVDAALAAAQRPLPILITNTARPYSDDFTGLVIDISKIAGPLPTNPDWLRQWRTGELTYATITNYDPITRRAVYTERGQSYGIDLPNPYPVAARDPIPAS